jgi:3-methylfumaryl-CoA hydratase
VEERAALKDYLGRTRTEEDEVTLGAVRRMAAMLDQDPHAYRRGSEMPESWYVILFGSVARESTLGPDGLPVAGDFLPHLPDARRMFGGRRVRFHAPLKVGDAVTRVSSVTRVEPKTGRSGAFTLVTIVHEMRMGGSVAVTEEQDSVYREPSRDGADRHAPSSSTVARNPGYEGEKPDWSRTITPDPVLLFRYSALTFNAHRIHYDLPYTRDVEKYPALVMNGGLTALLLVETARAHLKGPIAGYAARAMSPLFVGQSMTLNGRASQEGAELWACGPDGAPAYGVALQAKT